MDISKQPGYKDFLWAIELNRFGLELVGLWPEINGAARSNFASDFRVAVTFVIIIFLSVIPLICSLVEIWGDMILMIDNLQFTLPLLVISLKLVIVRRKRIALATIVRMIAEDWMEQKVDAERNVMLRRAQTARLIVISGYVLMLFGFIVVVIFPSFGLYFRNLTNLTDRNRLLPLQAHYFYDTDRSPQFELTYIVQAVTIFLGAITYTSVDSFFGLAVLHVCGQLENFRHRLVNLVLCKDFDGALRNKVETHLRLIRFAVNIEDIFTLMMLGLVFYFGIVFCLFGFLTFNVFTDDEISNISLTRLCFVAVGIITLLGHTFLYCDAGEIIVEQLLKTSTGYISFLLAKRG